MAKKFVRGITDVKTINNQDFDTNNVNDLLSDGQYNYIHRKKGKTEEYHNLTDNIKTLSSDNTELLSVTNNNKTTNTATLHPKHDAQKEQLLESTRNTISIHHGTNGTAEKTTVDTNPKKVLEHENLTVASGLLKSHTAEQNTTNLSVDFNTVQQKMSAGDGLSISNNKISIKPTTNGNPLNNGFYMGNIKNDVIASSIISLQSEGNRIVQLAFRESALTPNLMVMKYRFINEGTATDWKVAIIDNEQLLTLLSQKQDTLVAGSGITIQGNTISTTAPVEGASVSIQGFSSLGEFNAVRQVISTGQKTLTTFSFELYNESNEIVLTGELKEELGKFISGGYSASNGAVSITNDGTNMKLINSAPERHNIQHATFTFNRDTAAAGDVPS